MVSEFTVFGSCTCRDIFNSQINNNYKEYFHLGESGIRLSFISIMQKPVEYSKESLKIYPETKKNNMFSLWIEQDLNKSFLNHLKNNNFEYILIDTYYDTNFGIVDIGNNNYITNNMHLDETEFYKNLKYSNKLTIHEDTEKYVELWEKHCDLFFNFLKTNCPNLKILLNPTRHVENLLRKNNKISPINLYKNECAMYNPYRDLLDEYIIKNYDVDVLYFDENTLASENNLWGASSLHYVDSYFSDITNQLNNIIKRNNLLTKQHDDLNQKFEKQNREILELKILSNEKRNIIKNNLLIIKKYNQILKLNNNIRKLITELKENNSITLEDYEFLVNLNKNTIQRFEKDFELKNNLKFTKSTVKKYVEKIVRTKNTDN